MIAAYLHNFGNQLRRYILFLPLSLSFLGRAILTILPHRCYGILAHKDNVNEDHFVSSGKNRR